MMHLKENLLMCSGSKIEIDVTTYNGLVDVIVAMLVTGKLEGNDINFSAMHGQFTEEWQEAFKKLVAEKILETSNCTIDKTSGYPWQPYFSVTREDGSNGCISIFPVGGRFKSARWEGGRPMVGIVIRKKGSTINIDEGVWACMAPSLFPHGHGLIELEISDATE